MDGFVKTYTYSFNLLCPICGKVIPIELELRAGDTEDVSPWFTVTTLCPVCLRAKPRLPMPGMIVTDPLLTGILAKLHAANICTISHCARFHDGHPAVLGDPTGSGPYIEIASINTAPESTDLLCSIAKRYQKRYPEYKFDCEKLTTDTGDSIIIYVYLKKNQWSSEYELTTRLHDEARYMTDMLSDWIDLLREKSMLPKRDAVIIKKLATSNQKSERWFK